MRMRENEMYYTWESIDTDDGQWTTDNGPQTHFKSLLLPDIDACLKNVIGTKNVTESGKLQTHVKNLISH